VNLFLVGPTIALVLLFVTAMVIWADPIKAYVQSMLAFVAFSSVAVLVSLITGPETIKALLVSMSVGALVVSWILIRPQQFIFTIRNLVYLASFTSLVIGSQMVARTFGLSSIAFTDGYIIMLLGLDFQSGDNSHTQSGLAGLKRGFGLPAMQSLGSEGEYFVGLMPLFFLGAILATVWLVLILTNSWAQAMPVVTLFLVFVLSTEAITRHAFLINTHSIAWMLTALLLVYLRRQLMGDLDGRDAAGLVLLFSVIGLLRADYVILFGAFTLFFVLQNAATRPRLAIGIILAQGAAAVVWMTTTIVAFPFLGAVGPFIIFSGGMVASGLVVRLMWVRKRGVSIYLPTGLVVLASALLATTLILSNTSDSVRSLAINLFAGEGLWGFSIFAALLVWVGSYIRPQVLDRSFIKNAAAVGALTISLYLFSKYGDGVGQGYSDSGFSRIGFGDSLNRTMVTWLPFLVLPLIRLVGTVSKTGTRDRGWAKRGGRATR